MLDSLEPLAENLAGGAAVDWEAADSSELTASHKALLRQLRAIAQIASAHERFAREADVLLDRAAMETGGRSPRRAGRAPHVGPADPPVVPRARLFRRRVSRVGPTAGP